MFAYCCTGSQLRGNSCSIFNRRDPGAGRNYLLPPHTHVVVVRIIGCFSSPIVSDKSAADKVVPQRAPH